mmetsp:Transcript_11767/g.27341  ORF Transcript_11767/g.27341 Transcript_11767/m.27341 type:complete len:258 (+) Transcript_11767:37-810(+)
MRFRPCIDLHNGVVKQIVGGTLSDDSTAAPKENFAADKPSSYYADMYKADKLPGGHVIALGPGNEEAALAALKAYPGGMHMGGGVNPGNAQKFLDAGASHVIVTSYVFKDGKLDWDKLEEVLKVVGKQRLVLDLSCRKKEDGKYYVVTDRWQKFTDLAVDEETIRSLESKCSEFLVHAVDVEGKMSGIEKDIVAMLGDLVTIPCTYAGGATTMEDLKLVKELGKGKVDLTIGSALDIFGGSVKYSDVVAWQRGEEAA